jgi:HK97 gp10 family phage protein
MSVKVKMKSLNPQGFDKYIRTFEKQIKDKMNIAGNLVRNTAVQSILGGSKSGKVYEKYNPRRTHTSSSQGQAPASDTGFLASNITFNVKEGGMVAEVESKAKYSKFLEFGTQNMKARPFMFPALEENKPRIRRMFATTKGKAK